jgi:hypothetical protein
MPLGPAQVHAQEHRGPIRGFGASGARTDRQEGVALVVLAAEEEVAAGRGVLALQLRCFRGDVGQEVVVRFVLSKGKQLESGLGARFEVSPEQELLAQALGFADRLLRGALIVPETRAANGGVQLG